MREDMSQAAPAAAMRNLEKASSRLPAVQELPGDQQPEEIATPGMRTI